MSFERVKEIMMETINCGEDQISLDASLKDDIGIDSLDAMELSMALEDAYSITIGTEDLAGFVTVKNIVDFIDKAVA